MSEVITRISEGMPDELKKDYSEFTVEETTNGIRHYGLTKQGGKRPISVKKIVESFGFDPTPQPSVDAIWHTSDHDIPVKITGQYGRYGDEDYLSSSQSKAGIPRSELEFLTKQSEIKPSEMEELKNRLAEMESRMTEMENQLKAVSQERDSLKEDNTKLEEQVLNLQIELAEARGEPMAVIPEPSSLSPETSNSLPAMEESIVVEEEDESPVDNLSWRERFNNFRHGRTLHSRYIWHRENGAWARDDEPEVIERDNRVAVAALAVGGILVAWWLYNKYGVNNGHDQINQDINDLNLDIDGLRNQVKELDVDVDSQSTHINDRINELQEHIDDRIDAFQEDNTEQHQEFSTEHNDLEKNIEQHSDKSTQDHKELHGDIHPDANIDTTQAGANDNGGTEANTQGNTSNHLESLEFKGNNIWSDVEKNLKVKLGYQPSDSQIAKATNHVLQINGLSGHDARHLPVGFSYKIPNNLLEFANR